MAQTEVKRNQRIAPPASAPVAGTPSHTHVAPEHPQKAFELTDEEGRRALAWPSPSGWVVQSDDPALRRRVRQALRKPLWVWESVDEPDGERSCFRVQLQPDDPRYPNRLHWQWHQLGLDDLMVRVVTLPDDAPEQPGRWQPSPTLR